MRSVVVAFLCLTIASASQGPVTKVVELIEELKAKIEADGKMEQQIYDKYACWCETTSARKANDIHTAMSDIKSLGTKILELKGLVATRESEIAQDSMDIQSNQKAQDEATGSTSSRPTLPAACTSASRTSTSARATRASCSATRRTRRRARCRSRT